MPAPHRSPWSARLERLLSRGVEHAPAEIAIMVRRARAFGAIGLGSVFFMAAVSGMMNGHRLVMVLSMAAIAGVFAVTYFPPIADGRHVRAGCHIGIGMFLVGTDVAAILMGGANPVSVNMSVLLILFAAHVLGTAAAAGWTLACIAGVVTVCLTATMPESQIGVVQNGPVNLALVRSGVLFTVFLFAAAARRFQDRQTRELEFVARHDPLTELLNRSEFELRLREAAARCVRYQRKLALLFLDLDGFKQVNDDLGHQAGDRILRELADRIRAQTRATDLAGRIGGDEFLIALEAVPDEATAEAHARRILEAITNPIATEARSVILGASIGIALFPDDAGEVDALVHAADQAMYEAKYAGGDGVQARSSMEKRVSRR